MFLWLLLFLAPPLPIAVYLLLLGALNRGRHPVLVPGPWDFAGVLFAASGFLMCGGPVVLSFLNDRWRIAWLRHPAEPNAPDSAGSLFWLLLFVLYYLLVVAACAILLRRQRRFTAIYNTLPDTIEAALGQVFDQLGLHPTHTGQVYYFAESGTNKTAAQADKPNLALLIGPEANPLATLEIEPFLTMRHATLRWDPADWWLRKEIEKALAQRLMENATPRHDLGAWLTVLGISILGITLTGGCAGIVLLLMVQ